MDYGKKYIQKLSIIVSVTTSTSILVSFGLWILLNSIFPSDDLLKITFWVILSTGLIAVATRVIVMSSFKPLNALSDAIVFAGHSSRGGVAPDTDSLKIGREMITALALQVYDLASMSGQGSNIASEDNTQAVTSVISVNAVEQPSNSVIDHLGLPVFGIDKEQKITVINKVACEYLGIQPEHALGRPFYDVAKLSFQSDETFENWLSTVQNSVVNGVRMWARVRTTDPEGRAIKQFDLVASFSKQNQNGTETMLAIFDRTENYSRDDQEISFVALAVHELRTPLTIMKGYIEVFEDEVGPTLSPELTSFMHNMQASAQQLTAFVGNILNVARIEENQLVLKLQQRNWANILKNAVNDLALRAGVHGKHIELHIAGDMPMVAVDEISIHEVINNLVDNAIKYSGNSDKIVLSTGLNQDGLIETNVQDFGIGIPAAVMPDLFQKFYRSHKSSVQVSGTGLGLYISKSIISAHDGNIWVRSKENEGSIFTFTIHPYDQLKHEQANDQDGIMRGAHGWIKNHSLNRQ